MLAHRKAFPTPRGATGGCPPEHICGGRPHGPREGGKGNPEGGKGDPEGGKGDPEGGVYLCSLVLTAAGAGEGGAQRQGDFLSRGSFSA